MEHKSNLIFKKTEYLSCFLIINSFDHANFNKMISWPQCSELLSSSFKGPIAYQTRISIRHTSVVFRVFKIHIVAKALAHSPPATLFEYLFFFFYGKLYRPGWTDTWRDVLIKGIYKVFKFWPYFFFNKGGCGQTNATVYVVPDSSWWYDAGLPVKGSNTTDGKTVSPVHVRHGHGCL